MANLNNCPLCRQGDFLCDIWESVSTGLFLYTWTCSSPSCSLEIKAGHPDALNELIAVGTTETQLEAYEDAWRRGQNVHWGAALTPRAAARLKKDFIKFRTWVLGQEKGEPDEREAPLSMTDLHS